MIKQRVTCIYQNSFNKQITDIDDSSVYNNIFNTGVENHLLTENNFDTTLRNGTDVGIIEIKKYI